MDAPLLDPAPAAVADVTGASDPMTPAYRELLVRLLRDNWAAEAANLSVPHHARVLPLQLAPTIGDRARLAAYWADECRHAILFAELLAELGAGPTMADHDAVRPGELLNLPIEHWVDFGLFQLFADSAGCVHLGDYRTSSYLPMRRTALAILRDEVGHVRLGVANLAGALRDPAARDRAVAILPTWYRASLNLFGRVDRPSRRDQALIDHRLRRQPNAALRARFRVRVDRALRSVGLPVPEVSP